MYMRQRMARVFLSSCGFLLVMTAAAKLWSVTGDDPALMDFDPVLGVETKRTLCFHQCSRVGGGLALFLARSAAATGGAGSVAVRHVCALSARSALVWRHQAMWLSWRAPRQVRTAPGRRGYDHENFAWLPAYG